MTPLYSPWTWRFTFVCVILVTLWLTSLALNITPDVSCELRVR